MILIGKILIVVAILTVVALLTWLTAPLEAQRMNEDRRCKECGRNKWPLL